MKTTYLTRHQDILPTDKCGMEIAIVGAGAIGSQVTLCLAKMGFTDITVYDYDTVDEENMNCQWYGPEDIGFKKVDSLRDQVERMTGVTITTSDTKVGSDTGPLLGQPDLIICAVDSMEVRASLWAAYQDSGVRHWVDPRMGAEEGLLYYVDVRSQRDRDRYEKTLYTDEEASSEPCTAKSTMYCAMMLAGHVAKLVKDMAVESEVIHTVHWNIRENAYVSYKNQTLKEG